MTTCAQASSVESVPREFRVVVVPLIQNDQGEYLICKMPGDRGVFPGKWGLPGGGIEKGERMEEALMREVREELGIAVTDVKPLFFKDGEFTKCFAGGKRRPVYMIFLIFSCLCISDTLKLNEEFCDYAWVAPPLLPTYDLNETTIETFKQAGIVSLP